MTSIENNEQPAAQGAQDITSCPHWGKGGQYVRDPVTGERTLVTPPHEPETVGQVEAAATVPAALAAPAIQAGDETQAPATADTAVFKEKKRAS